MSGWVRPRDEYGRAWFAPNEVPDEGLAHWKGLLTHPTAVHIPPDHRVCDHGWIESGEWWLHCGTCNPPLPEPSEEEK